ncbi:MAG: NosD domain-containing protein, partial [Dehalococcoidia bacterium]
FIVRNSARTVSNEPAGIRVTADRATIEGNRLEDVLYGVILDGSDQHVVRNNHVSSIRDLPAERRGHALYVYDSADSLLVDNVVDYAKDGVFLGFAVRTTVERNQISHVRYGLHTMYSDDLTLRGNVLQDNVAGASLMYSRGVAVFDNEFSGSRSLASGYGLLFKDVDDVELVGNRIHNNRIGMIMDGAPRTPGHYVTLRGNLIAYNQVALELFTTTGVTFSENSFVGNLRQVESRGGDLEHRNNWSLDGRGNYWDDYQGFDANGDGIGDIPYRYEGVYDDLVRHHDALRAFAHTPAQTALDLAGRWFPVYRLEPTVVDPHPLVAPTIGLAVASADRMNLPAALTGLVLISGSSVVFLAGRRHGRAWA